MDRAGWRPVYSVRGGKVQADDRKCNLLGLCGRDVLYNSRVFNLRCMPHLSVKLQLTCGERSVDKLCVETCIFIMGIFLI
jgi:hypothetical protein